MKKLLFSNAVKGSVHKTRNASTQFIFHELVRCISLCLSSNFLGFLCSFSMHFETFSCCRMINIDVCHHQADSSIRWFCFYDDPLIHLFHIMVIGLINMLHIGLTCKFLIVISVAKHHHHQRQRNTFYNFNSCQVFQIFVHNCHMPIYCADENGRVTSHVQSPVLH